MKQIDFKKIYAQGSPWAILLLVGMLLFSLIECQNRKYDLARQGIDLDREAANVEFLENELGQVVAENRQLAIENSDQFQTFTDSIFQLKKQNARVIKQVNEYARINQRLKTGPILAPFDPVDTLERDVVHVDTTGGPPDTTSIKVPRGFGYISPDSLTSVKGIVTFQGVLIDSIKALNTLHYRSVTKKTGFLGLGRSTSVQVLNTNPDVETIGLTSLVVPHRVGWWHRWGKPVTFAILAAVAVDQFRK